MNVSLSKTGNSFIFSFASSNCLRVISVMTSVKFSGLIAELWLSSFSRDLSVSSVLLFHCWNRDSSSTIFSLLKCSFGIYISISSLSSNSLLRNARLNFVSELACYSPEVCARSLGRSCYFCPMRALFDVSNSAPLSLILSLNR